MKTPETVGDLKIWSPSTVGEGYAISDCGGWLPGLYDSRECAIAAYKLTQKEGGHAIVAKMSERVNSVFGDNRLITLSDWLSLHND